jgi:hypothetical protein
MLAVEENFRSSPCIPRRTNRQGESYQFLAAVAPDMDVTAIPVDGQQEQSSYN